MPNRIKSKNSKTFRRKNSKTFRRKNSKTYRRKNNKTYRRKNNKIFGGKYRHEKIITLEELESSVDWATEYTLDKVNTGMVGQIELYGVNEDLKKNLLIKGAVYLKKYISFGENRIIVEEADTGTTTVFNGNDKTDIEDFQGMEEFEEKFVSFEVVNGKRVDNVLGRIQVKGSDPEIMRELLFKGARALVRYIGNQDYTITASQTEKKLPERKYPEEEE
jgi:hypothetical protein